MNRIQEFLQDRLRNHISFMMSIAEDWEKFDEIGQIGDCQLRRTAKEYIEETGRDLTIVHIMKDIAFENYRNLANYWQNKADYWKEEFIEQCARADELSWQVNSDRQGGI